MALVKIGTCHMGVVDLEQRRLWRRRGGNVQETLVRLDCFRKRKGKAVMVMEAGF